MEGVRTWEPGLACGATRACGARSVLFKRVRVTCSRLGRDTSDDSCAFAGAKKHQAENVIKTVAAVLIFTINYVLDATEQG